MHLCAGRKEAPVKKKRDEEFWGGRKWLERLMLERVLLKFPDADYMTFGCDCMVFPPTVQRFCYE